MVEVIRVAGGIECTKRLELCVEEDCFVQDCAEIVIRQRTMTI